MKCPNCKIPLSTSPRHTIHNVEPIGAQMLGHIIAGLLNLTQIDIYKCTTCGSFCFHAHETEIIRSVED